MSANRDGKSGLILPAGTSVRGNSARGANVGSSVECSECGDKYTKVMPGLNICGTCQVVWAIKMFWAEMQMFRWGLKRFNVTMHEDGTASFERIIYPWEVRNGEKEQEQA